MKQVWVPESMIFDSASEALKAYEGAVVLLCEHLDAVNLQKQNEILIEALKLYADENSWTFGRLTNLGKFVGMVCLGKDGGYGLARESLAQVEKMKG